MGRGKIFELVMTTTFPTGTQTNSSSLSHASDKSTPPKLRKENPLPKCTLITFITF